VLVFIESIAYLDLAFQAMHGQVHPRQLAVQVGFFLAVEDDVDIVGVFVARIFDKVAGLHNIPAEPQAGSSTVP